ncbi:hypothetical protein CRENPOLYSF2_40003 [Crenothrix polyspora]|uniref:Uncharacterized protein n=1 Tax=Crenothrix polyspora TaxID=360316 RepID=A0A1R4HDW3_9GAMM|nr:hypothetical protein [Crenothrix polyspora]SJM94406.1 hypothetical protein CRENPOLYSF2_40003 [Crenothrix polyspora]
MTSSIFYLLSSIFIIIITAWIIINRKDNAIKREHSKIETERRATQRNERELQINKYHQIVRQLKDPLIQNLWRLCDESATAGLIDSLGIEQFNVSDNAKYIVLKISWEAKNDALSQLALKRLTHKHAITIAAEYSLSLHNVHCDALQLELTFSNKDENAHLGVPLSDDEKPG